MCLEAVKYIVVFGLGTLAVSLIMKLLEVSAYGDLVGLIALLSEVCVDARRVC
jgi:hypothetical protein